MGSMVCHRGDCTNAMCNRHSSVYGYICNDCFHELEALVRAHANDIALPKIIHDFMDSPKSRHSTEPMVAELDRIFEPVYKPGDLK